MCSIRSIAAPCRRDRRWVAPTQVTEALLALSDDEVAGLSHVAIIAIAAGLVLEANAD